MSGNIIVVEPESRFKKIDKSLIENPNIDCLTLGIYAKIVTFGFDLNVKYLSIILGLSDKKIRKSLVLLEKEGYIVRTDTKNECSRLIQKPTTLEPDNTENGQDINNNTKNNNKTILTNKKEKDKEKEKMADPCKYCTRAKNVKRPVQKLHIIIY